MNAETQLLSQFDVPTAQQYAREGRLEEWIHAYLNTGYWNNPGLSEGLKLQKRWWRGPLQIKLADLTRCCGPELHMKFYIDPKNWTERTTKMAQSMTDPLVIPPLIVEYHQGELSIRDGSTRHEAMRLKGWQTCWVLIWYNTEEDYQTHENMRYKEGSNAMPFQPPEQMENPIIIRKMEEEDITTIFEVFKKAPWNKPLEQFQCYFREQCDGKRLVFVAFYNNEFAGYGTICWISGYEPFAKANIPEIVDLNVLYQFRRKGIATQLMDRAEAEIARRSDTVGIGVGLYSDYGPAQRLYVLRGYVPDACGLMRNGKPVEPGTSIVIDDSLTIQLTRKLK